MKKPQIFDLVLLIFGVLLFLLRVTGMTAHIIISLLGIIVLAMYTITTKKVTNKSKLNLKAASGGGFAISIKEIK